MSGIKNLKFIALDSNLFIYHFEGHPELKIYTLKIFKNLGEGKLKAVTSLISLIETLSYPSSAATISKITDEFRNILNLDILDVNFKIAIEAARIRREYNFRLPDSIQLATAKVKKAQAIITNDKKLIKFKELKVISLKEI